MNKLVLSSLLLSFLTMMFLAIANLKSDLLETTLVFNHSTGSFFVKPKELISSDSTGQQKTITSTGSLDMLPYLPPASLYITCGTGMIKIHFDGRVEIPDGVSLPEASKIFWDAVVIFYPEFKQTIISQYEKEKKK